MCPYRVRASKLSILKMGVGFVSSCNLVGIKLQLWWYSFAKLVPTKLQLQTIQVATEHHPRCNCMRIQLQLNMGFGSVATEYVFNCKINTYSITTEYHPSCNWIPLTEYVFSCNSIRSQLQLNTPTKYVLSCNWTPTKLQLWRYQQQQCLHQGWRV